MNTKFAPRHRRIAAAALALLTTLALPAGADAAFGDRTLKKGSRGSDVRVLQRWMTETGVKVRADGVFGQGTARRVQRFEQVYGLKVDGRVTPSQARWLRRLVQRQRAAGTPAGGAAPRNAMPTAKLAPDGRTAIAPDSAPQAVKAAVAAANAITSKPYRYGGGHRSFEDSGYDCSGAVSYALHGGGLLESPLDSSSFMRWGDAGPGQWITVYTNPDHAYVMIAGLRFDTSGRGEKGPRWRPEARSSRGFTARHPAGL